MPAEPCCRIAQEVPVVKTSVRRILATAVTTGAVGVAAPVPASPAMATAHGCTIPGGGSISNG
jgi:hypothetical protein